MTLLLEWTNYYYMTWLLASVIYNEMTWLLLMAIYFECRFRQDYKCSCQISDRKQTADRTKSVIPDSVADLSAASGPVGLWLKS